MSNPWKSSQHFVSPMNYLEEVTSAFVLPKKVKLHDVTLRDGEQETGVALRKDEKVRIAELLAEAGINRIEAGMPVVSKQDEQAIREIVKRNLGPEIFGFSRCIVDDVKLVADCGVSGVVIEIPSSEHIIEYAYDWPISKAIDLSVMATQAAHERGLYVVFFTIDATRASLESLLEIIGKVAAEGHMDGLALVDTMGAASVPAIHHYIKKVRAKISKPLEAHFHNDFGLAIANSLAAVEEGAEVVHTTVLGMGERSGQAATEQVALALKLLYAIDTGVRLDRLHGLCRETARITGHVYPGNQPVVGSDVFRLESGIPSSWWLKIMDTHPTEVFPYLPSLVGLEEPEVVLGKGSGTDSVRFWLKRIDRSLDQAQVVELTALVKEESMSKKGLLNENEFRALVDGYVGRMGC